MVRIVNAENLSHNPVNATQAAANVSAKYAFASTAEILSVFEAQGWKAVSQTAILPRKQEKFGFQKHMVRLEHADFTEIPGLDANNCTRPQLLIINSHDRASSLRLMWGAFRMACLNGLVYGDAVSEIRLGHNGKLAERLPDAIARLLTSFPTLMEQSQRLANAQLTDAAVAKLVKTVYDARLEGTKDIVKVDYSLPYVRRSEDRGNDAFTIFNRVQEVAVRGGINYLATQNERDEAGNVTDTRIVRGRTRAVNAIAASVKINTVAYNAALALV